MLFSPRATRREPTAQLTSGFSCVEGAIVTTKVTRRKWRLRRAEAYTFELIVLARRPQEPPRRRAEQAEEREPELI